MDWKLEVVVLPVSDVDRARDFYVEKIGFHLDVDQEMGESRIVQMTPPGSGCSVTVGRGLNNAEPGSVKGMQLCVGDIEAARAELAARGVEVSPIRHVGPEGWADGNGGDWNAFIFFDDPDGNSWTVQESPTLRAELQASTAAASYAGNLATPAPARPASRTPSRGIRVPSSERVVSSAWTSRGHCCHSGTGATSCGPARPRSWSRSSSSPPWACWPRPRSRGQMSRARSTRRGRSG